MAAATLVVTAAPAGSAGSTSRASVYVSNVDGASVSVIDPATNEVSTTIDVSGGGSFSEPRNLAPNPAGTFVYVPIRFGSTGTSTDGALGVIDTSTDTLVTIVEHASFDEPYAVTVSNDNAFVYVANKAGNTVSVFDAASESVVGTVTDGGGCVDSPEGAVTDPVRAQLYIVNRNGDSVCVVDTTTNVITANITVGNDPRSAVVTPNGAFLYVANNGDASVSKVDLATNVVTPIAVNGNPRNLAISSNGALVFVPTQDNELAVIDVATDGVTYQPFTRADGCEADQLYAATVIPGTNLGYVTDEDEDQVYGFDATTGAEVRTSTQVCPFEVTPESLPVESPDFDTTRAITSVGDPVEAPEIVLRFTG